MMASISPKMSSSVCYTLFFLNLNIRGAPAVTFVSNFDLKIDCCLKLIDVCTFITPVIL